MAKRKMPRKRKQQPPKPFRSWFEHDFAKKFNQLDYETLSIDYVSEHKYTPDFLSGSGKYLFELKGRFRSSGEAKKYIDIRRCLPPQYEIVFIFMNPDTPMPNAKRRKDGTKATLREWADRHNFKWATIDTVPKEWTR